MILSLPKVGWDTGSEEAKMGLSRYIVATCGALVDIRRRPPEETSNRY
jgi:hypothetical protein